MFGLVSNVWAVQLSNGESLEDLVARAVGMGCQTIELRQGFLGEFEKGNRMAPEVNRLKELSIKYNQVQWIAAYEVPFLNYKLRVTNQSFRVGLRVAQAVQSINKPCLRIVDTETVVNSKLYNPVTSGKVIARLTQAVAEIGGVLSVENARQPWAFLSVAINKAREFLGLDQDKLRVCFDPCNFFFANDKSNPEAALQKLSVDELGMIHFKQRYRGKLSNVLRHGDVNWMKQMEILNQKKYFKPWLFEMASHSSLWGNIETSIKYLDNLAKKI